LGAEVRRAGRACCISCIRCDSRCLRRLPLEQCHSGIVSTAGRLRLYSMRYPAWPLRDGDQSPVSIRVWPVAPYVDPESSMRKIIFMMSVSVDGFMAAPDGGLDWQVVDEELHSHFNQWMAKAGAFLDGRVTYELMARHWPTADADPSSTP